MNLQAYLKRIHYTGDTSPTFETLGELQRAHLLHVPFENLDIHHHTKIELTIEKVAHKVITCNRGGFCYELNGLFYELLKQLGYQVKRVSARVYTKEKGYGPEYGHLTIIVTIKEQSYLVDVGFGAFTLQPLRLALNTVQKDECGEFRMDHYDNTYLRVSKKTDEGWAPEYIFTTQHQAYQDYAGMCHYQQTSPDSYFTQQRLCTLLKPDGRVTISGNQLKITREGIQTEEALADEMAYHQALDKHFRIKLYT